MGVDAYYAATILDFREDDDDHIHELLTTEHRHALESQMQVAWPKRRQLFGVASSNQPRAILLMIFIPRIGKHTNAIFRGIA